jgi:hypothetical protein
VYSGQRGRPSPFGSPVEMKLTQYDDIASVGRADDRNDERPPG